MCVLHITGADNLIKIEGEMQVASPLLSFILPSANKLGLLQSSINMHEQTIRVV